MKHSTERIEYLPESDYVLDDPWRHSWEDEVTSPWARDVAAVYAAANQQIGDLAVVVGVPADPNDNTFIDVSPDDLIRSAPEDESRARRGSLGTGGGASVGVSPFADLGEPETSGDRRRSSRPASGIVRTAVREPGEAVSEEPKVSIGWTAAGAGGLVAAVLFLALMVPAAPSPERVDLDMDKRMLRADRPASHVDAAPGRQIASAGAAEVVEPARARHEAPVPGRASLTPEAANPAATPQPSGRVSQRRVPRTNPRAAQAARRGWRSRARTAVSFPLPQPTQLSGGELTPATVDAETW